MQKSAFREQAGKCDFSWDPLWSVNIEMWGFIIRAKFLWILSGRFGNLIDLPFLDLLNCSDVLFSGK